jgi:hypothetical protein
MSIKLKLIAVVAVLAFGVGTPAFAQAFSQSVGTGNVLPSCYDQSGALHVLTPTAQGPIAGCGLYDFAPVGTALPVHPPASSWHP